MKQLILNIFFSLIVLPVFSQITIDAIDMPAQGDTLRVSLANQIAIDYTRTGYDTTWDFSSLIPASQRIESFVNPTSTPALYWVVFTPYTVTNLAAQGTQSGVFPGIVATDPYTFYNKSSSSYKDVGFGVTIMGIPIPAKYDNPDIYYTFPLTSTTHTWSSSSTFTTNIPGMGSFNTSRIRSSIVDGWGTIITPFGTFQAIRVKSHLIEHDSIYLDTLGIGIPVDRDITEYKWLAKGQGVPVLQVNSEGITSTATYRDIYRLPTIPLSADLGSDTTACLGYTVMLNVHVSGGVPPYRYLWNTLDTTRSITVRIDSASTFFVSVIDAVNNFSFDSKVVNAINCNGINEQINNSLRIIPNPSPGLFFLDVPSTDENYTLQILTITGSMITERNIRKSENGKIPVDLTSYSPGSYLLKLINSSSIFIGKLIINKP